MSTNIHLPSYLKVQRLTEELAAAQKKLREYEDSYFASHLRAQRVTEELAAVQKKVKEYEDLFATLYHDVCGHCKEIFETTGAGGGRMSTLVARTFVKVPPVSDGNGSPQFRIVKRPRIFLHGSFPSRCGPTTSLVSPPPGSFQGGNSRHVQVSTKQIKPSAGPFDSILLPGDKPIQAQYTVKFHDVTVGIPALQVTFDRVWTHSTVIYAMKFSPDGNHLAVGIAKSVIDSQKTYIYDVSTGRQCCLLADPSAEKLDSAAEYLSFSPGDGRYLATGHSTGQTMIWHVGKKHVRNVFGNHPVRQNYCVDFSPDGRFIVSSSFEGSRVRIWSMRDGSSTLLRDHDDEAFTTVLVKFSPDGKLVIASDRYGILRLWNVRTAKLVRKWKAHKTTVLGAAFAPNGQGLVTGSLDHTLKYWDLGLGASRETEVLKFVGHTKDVRSVAISPDGRLVASGSHDCTARIWDMVDGSLQCTLLGHRNGVSRVDFSATGNYLACGSWDGDVSLWRYELSRD